MKNLLYLIAILTSLSMLTAESWDEKEKEVDDVKEKTLTSLPDYVTPIAAKRGFSASLSEDQIRQLASIGMKTIVRLNGDTPNDKGHLSIEEESMLCAALGLRFYYFNIEGRINEAAAEVANLLLSPGVVIHCRNGVHRAPAMAAFYLKTKGYPRSLIVDIVNWEKLIENPGRYKKYTQVVLPA